MSDLMNGYFSKNALRMTFIASVVSRKGVALIADSLVTTSKPVLEFDDFFNYLGSARKDEAGEIIIDTTEVVRLFKTKPSYTQDYHEKLFQYDKYTSIAIAGAAYLNGKSIEEIIHGAIRKYKPNAKANKKTIDQKVEELQNYFSGEVLETHAKGEMARYTVLIITHYLADEQKTKIFKFTIHKSSAADQDVEGFEPVTVALQDESFKVVCDGQNRISERILWGELDFLFEIIPRITQKVFTDFGIENAAILPKYINELFSDSEILPPGFYDDIKMLKIVELSLQQAIDLACLLMKIERDIQGYTENIPTVGGVIKIAVIDREGFRFIAGNDLTVLKEFK